GVGILAAIRPGINASVGDDGARKVLIHEPVRQVDAVAHPLVGDAARELLVKAEFEIELRVKGSVGLGQEPLAPVRILLADLLNLRATAPARAVVVPNDFDLADVAQRPAPDRLARRPRIKLAAMLRADLDDQVPLE